METEKRLTDNAPIIRDLTAMKSEYDCITLDGIIKALKEVPTVDAVEVIRCKDCRNCKVEQMSIPGDDLFRQFPMYVCKHPRGEVGTDPLYMEADDFCSYGERKDK